MKTVLAILAAAVSHAAIATELTWDTTSNDGPSITYDSGIWNLTSRCWNTGLNNVAWSNTPLTNAVIPGAASGVPTITIGADALTVGKITVGGAGSTTVLAGSYAKLTANEIAIQTSGAGKLAITTAETLANVAAFSIANGATLYLDGSTVDSSVSVQGNGNNENRGALRLNGGTLQGSITLLGDTTFGSSGTGLIHSTITGGFAFNQAPVSTGTVRFTGDNSFTGGTTISNGTVQAGHNNAFGSGTLRLNGGTLSSDSAAARTLANPVTIGGQVRLGNGTNTGELTFTNAVQSPAKNATITADSNVEFADLSADGTLNFAGAGQVVLGKFTALSSDAILAGGTVILAPRATTFDTKGFNAVVSAPLKGATGITKIGQGTLTLNASTAGFSGPAQVAAGTLKLASARVLPANLKMMPMGDSITFGSNGGYRYPLYQNLQAVAPNFHFVGESTVGPGPLPAGYQNHCGHSSYSTDDIRKNLDGLDYATFSTYGGAERDPHGGRWITGLPSPVTYTVPKRGTFTYGPRDPITPDVILLLVGTNDVFRADSTDTKQKADYTALLDEIFLKCPAVHVFMAKLIPTNDHDIRVDAYNRIVSAVYNDFKAAGKNVTLVNLNTGFPSGGFENNLHPNAAGYAWMAGKWREAVLGALGTEVPFDFRNASSIGVSQNATLTGSALVNHLTIQGSLAPGDGIGTVTATSASISGTYSCEVSGGKADLLAVQGNLILFNATLAISTLQAPTAPVIPVATYTGTLTGTFASVTGTPAGYQLLHDESNKRFVLKKKSP